MDILSKLIEERKKRKISQNQMAKKMKISQSALSNWERGVVDIPFGMLLKFAREVRGRVIFFPEDMIEELFI